MYIPSNKVLESWGIVVIIQVLGKYMITLYLDP